MNRVGDIFTLMVVGSIIYLFLVNGDTTVQLVREGTNFVTGTLKTVQGRG